MWWQSPLPDPLLCLPSLRILTVRVRSHVLAGHTSAPMSEQRPHFTARDPGASVHPGSSSNDRPPCQLQSKCVVAGALSPNCSPSQFDFAGIILHWLIPCLTWVCISLQVAGTVSVEASSTLSTPCTWAGAAVLRTQVQRSGAQWKGCRTKRYASLWVCSLPLASWACTPLRLDPMQLADPLCANCTRAESHMC